MYKSLYDKLLNKEEKLSLVGLGYVGMPIAVAFAKKIDVVGFDLNAKKIELYKNGIDPTNEVGNDAIKATTVEFTADETKLKKQNFTLLPFLLPLMTPTRLTLHLLKEQARSSDVISQKAALLSLSPPFIPA